jgi:transposase
MGVAHCVLTYGVSASYEVSRARILHRPTMHTTDDSKRDPEAQLREAAIVKLRSGVALGDVAEELQISVAALCRWIADAAANPRDSGGECDPEELRRLRLENDYLRKQRDFYRKAAGIVDGDLLKPSGRR